MKRPRYWLEPLWHQISYQLAAADAHLGFPEAAEETRTFDLRPLGVEGVLRESPAAGVARELLEASRSVLHRPPLALFHPERIHRALPLLRFLRSTIEPSAALLLADQSLRRNPAEALRAALLRWAVEPTAATESRASAAEGEDAHELIQYVEQHRQRSYRVDYNLACVYVRVVAYAPARDELVDKRKWVDHTIAMLRRSLRRAPAATGTRLARWASLDPSLELVRQEPQFQSLIDVYAGFVARSSGGATSWG